MKRNAIKGLLFALFLLCSPSLWAEDFSDDSTGTTLFYNFIEGTDSVEVTYTNSVASSYLYSGNIIIPETVTYEGTTYYVETIGDYLFNGCTGLTSVEMPNSVTKIGAHAFAYCSGLTSIEIPSSVTSIGEYAFAYCGSLTSVNIPSGVTSIENSTFYYCTSLKSVILGSSVETISRYAFYYCPALTEIVSFNTVPPTFTYDTPPTIYGTNGVLSVTLYVPAGSKDTYSEDTPNSTHTWSTWNPNATNSSIAKIKEFLEVDITAQEAAVTSEVAETIEDDGEGNSEEVKYGYSTFYSGKPFYTSYSYPLTNDLKCATASVSDGTLTMNWAYGNNSEADVVPGGTAVVLYGPLGTNYPVIYEEGDDASVSAASEDNMLLGSEEETETTGPNGETDGYIFYMLSYSEKNDNGECENMGFYYGAPDGAAFTSKANKAWLPVPDDGSGAKITSFVFGYDAGETTAIRTIDSSKPESDAIYNLQGIRVNDMNRKGIYIVGGKKMIKK